LEAERRSLEEEDCRERLDLSQANEIGALENQLAALIAYGKISISSGIGTPTGSIAEKQ